MKLLVERNGIGQAVDTIFQVSFAIGMEHGEVDLREEKVSLRFASAVNVSSLVAVVDFNMKVSSVQGVTIHILHRPNVFKLLKVRAKPEVNHVLNF